jgi:hypothetical protein
MIRLKSRFFEKNVFFYFFQKTTNNDFFTNLTKNSKNRPKILTKNTVKILHYKTRSFLRYSKN